MVGITDFCVVAMLWATDAHPDSYINNPRSL